MEEIHALLKELKSADWWVRSNAMKTLLGYPEAAYLPFLEEALRNHENANLRNASMDFYRSLNGRALPSLFNLIKDDDPEVRLFAANLLGDIADRRALPALVGALKDTDVNVRIASAEALGKTGDPVAIGALEEALGDEPWVTMSAIKSIGDLGGDGALEILYRCLDKEEYRGITIGAIARAGNESAIRYLTPFVDRDELRELALTSIVAIAEKEGVRLMPEYFMSLVPLLVSLQKSPHDDLKRSAFIALSWSRDVRGLPYLIEALDDEELQEYAIRGIVGIGEEAVPEIMDALKDPLRPQRSVLANILALLGEDMALIQFSGDDDPEVRVEVALALGHGGSPRAVELLSAMLDDPDNEVSSAAQLALQCLRGRRDGQS